MSSVKKAYELLKFKFLKKNKINKYSYIKKHLKLSKAQMRKVHELAFFKNPKINNFTENLD